MSRNGLRHKSPFYPFGIYIYVCVCNVEFRLMYIIFCIRFTIMYSKMYHGFTEVNAQYYCVAVFCFHFVDSVARFLFVVHIVDLTAMMIEANLNITRLFRCTVLSFLLEKYELILIWFFTLCHFVAGKHTKTHKLNDRIIISLQIETENHLICVILSIATIYVCISHFVSRKNPKFHSHIRKEEKMEYVNWKEIKWNVFSCMRAIHTLLSECSQFKKKNRI